MSRQTPPDQVDADTSRLSEELDRLVRKTAAHSEKRR